MRSTRSFVEEGAQVRVLVDEGQEGRVLFVVVGSLVVPAAMIRPHLLKGFGDIARFGRKEARETQEAEEVKEPGVLLAQAHWISSKACV